MLCSLVFCHFPNWCPGSGMVHDCTLIDEQEKPTWKSDLYICLRNSLLTIAMKLLLEQRSKMSAYN